MRSRVADKLRKFAQACLRSADIGENNAPFGASPPCLQEANLLLQEANLFFEMRRDGGQNSDAEERREDDFSRRHCERSEAIQAARARNWIASSLRSSQ
jgi:hypothetical protein